MLSLAAGKESERKVKNKCGGSMYHLFMEVRLGAESLPLESYPVTAKEASEKGRREIPECLL